MVAPVSGIVRVSEEVAEYRSNTPRRLCVQKVGEREWEVQFVTEGEEITPSWYSEHSTLFQRIRDVFWSFISLFYEEPKKIILDTSLSISEGMGVRLETRYSEGTTSVHRTTDVAVGNSVRKQLLLSLENHIPSEIFSHEWQLALQEGVHRAKEIEDSQRQSWW